MRSNCVVRQCEVTAAEITTSKEKIANFEVRGKYEASSYAVCLAPFRYCGLGEYRCQTICIRSE